MKNISIILLLLCISYSLHSQRTYNCEANKVSYSEKHIISKPINNLENNYDVKFYKIDLNVSNTSTFISGSVTINAVVQNNILDTIVFELINSLTVDSLFVNGINYNFIHNDDEIIIKLQSPLFIGLLFSTKIYYHGTSTGSGISNASFLNIPVTWTLSESFHFKDWAPCKQSLNDKVDSVYIFITTDSGLKVGSNGLLKSVVNLPGNKVRYEWKSFYPIDYYLISFTVGNYHEYNIYAHPYGIQDSILIQNYLLNNPLCLSYYKQIIDSTRYFIELLSSKYGMYPFKNEKYGHCMAPIGGGMEHQTMTTLDAFDFELIIHELGHMWFGNYVTCGTWQDIWINEGFATYTYYIGSQNLQTQCKADYWMSDIHNDIMSKPDGSVYLSFEEAANENRIFDERLSYEKGAAIIHQIRFELNSDILFFKVLKNFLALYKNKTATGADFKQVLETTSGINFDDFFNQWYYGEGYPIYNIIWNQQNDSLILKSIQTTSTTITPLFKMSMEYKLCYAGGDTTIRIYQNSNTQVFKVFVPHKITGIVVDPNNWVLNKIGSVTQGINENIYDDLLISCYPNPFVDNIFLEFLDNKYNHTIKLIKITGNIIFEISTNDKSIDINTRDIAKGIYFLKVDNGIYNYVKKLIKQ